MCVFKLSNDCSGNELPVYSKFLMKWEMKMNIAFNLFNEEERLKKNG